MSWRQTFLDRSTDILRFAIRGAALLAGIAATLACTYVLVKLCWFSVRYLDRTIFSQPW